MSDAKVWYFSCMKQQHDYKFAAILYRVYYNDLRIMWWVWASYNNFFNLNGTLYLFTVHWIENLLMIRKIRVFFNKDWNWSCKTFVWENCLSALLFPSIGDHHFLSSNGISETMENKKSIKLKKKLDCFKNNSEALDLREKSNNSWWPQENGPSVDYFISYFICLHHHVDQKVTNSTMYHIPNFCFFISHRFR